MNNSELTIPTMTPLTSPDKIRETEAKAFRAALLNWYDRHRRRLPWRAEPRMSADPYHVWLSEIMLQQTTVGAVIPYFVKFVEKWPTVHDLAAATVDDVMREWAGLGYYARARNLHKCAKVVSTKYQGRFPQDTDMLKSLPGIGDYTAAAIMSIAFDLPATVIDGNVERVMARLFSIKTPLPAGKKDIGAYAAALSSGYTDRPSDYAQALMDIGATICIPKAPRCSLCPLQAICRGHFDKIAATLPARAAKAPRPKRIGYAYIIRREDGSILIEKRPGKGLLGGMIGFPTSEWVDRDAPLKHPDFINTHNDQIQVRKELEIRHVFTHFELSLTPAFLDIQEIHIVKIRENAYWVPVNELANIGFPTAFKKIERLISQNIVVST